MTIRDDWAELIGPEWAAHVAATDAALGPFGEEARTRLALKEGEHVLDLGCGAGTSTLSLARDVGGTGKVTAIDVSPDLAALARGRASGAENIEVIEADAALHPFEPESFEALFSRFGCMFFDDPEEAWLHLHRALKPGARVSLVAWRTLEENNWARVPMEATEGILDDPYAVPTGEKGGGPFGWADPKVFEPLLEGAGFREVVREKIEKKVPYGTGEEGDDPLERAVQMMTRIGPMARRLKTVDDGTRAKVAKRLRKLLRPFEDDDAVRMTGRAWLITALA